MIEFLLPIFLIWFGSPPTSAQLPCHEAGYCSLGLLGQPFVGDIASTEGLRKALTACSFRDEIILLSTTLSVLDNALQLYDMIAKLGLAHQILLASDNETCSKALQIRPNMCCIWSSLELPEAYFQHQLLLWNTRRSLAARAVRLGYNIMVLDNDVVVFDDPYKFLKKGPFRDTHLMTMGETWPYESNSLLNLGWLYAQNARPDGPVAAILAEVPDRQLRYADDNARGMSMWKASHNCGTDEQLLFDDAVFGSAIGRPVSVVSMRACGGSAETVPEAAAAARQLENFTMLKEACEKLETGDQVFTQVTEEVPEDWQALVGQPTMMVKRANLKWWHAQDGQWPLELGGEMLPPTRGPLSTHFRATLASECRHPGPDGACPMWPDAADPKAAAAVVDGPVERFALAPPWLVASFTARGLKGLWGQHPGKPVQQVIGHVHQTSCDSNVGKRAIHQYLGHYNWSLARQLKGQEVFFASTPERPLPKAIALVPCLQLGRLVRTLEDFKAILRGMVAVAFLMNGRAILLPDLPCHLPFIEATPGGSGSVPLNLDPHFMARGKLEGTVDTGGRRRSPVCTWQKFLMMGCVSGPSLAILPWEWEEFKSALSGQGRLVEPSANNTVALMRHMKDQEPCQAISRGPGHGSRRKERTRFGVAGGHRGHEAGSVVDGETLVGSVDHMTDHMTDHMSGERGRSLFQASGDKVNTGGERLGMTGYVWEADARELMNHLRSYEHEDIVYLRRPILVNWGEHLLGNSNVMTSLSIAKLRYDQVLSACFEIKEGTGEQPDATSNMRKRPWNADSGI